MSTPENGNTRRIRWVRYKGERKSIKDWARTLKLNYRTLYTRLTVGKTMTFEEAMSKPARKMRDPRKVKAFL